jgi:hypothetical protein
LILYGLQTASGNLRHANFEAYPPSVVIDPASVDETLVGEYVWENSDFDGEEEDGKNRRRTRLRTPPHRAPNHRMAPSRRNLAADHPRPDAPGVIGRAREVECGFAGQSLVEIENFAIRERSSLI